MSKIDLAGADWQKIDPYIFHLVTIASGNEFSFSGTREEWILEFVKRDKIPGIQFPMLIKVKGSIKWPLTQVPGLFVLSRIGPTIAIKGTFETIVALAKDENVLSVEKG